MITYFIRKKHPGQNSIEELFDGIIKVISEVETTKTYEVPYKSARPMKVLKNIRFARSKKGEVNHITGDINYLTLGLGKNTVLTLHDIGSGLTGNWLKRQYFKLFWLVLPVKYAGALTVISKTSYDEILEIIPFAKHKLHVIPNTFRPDLLLHRRDNMDLGAVPRVLLVGTKPNKNIERCLKAMSGLEIAAVVVGKLTALQRKLAVDLKIQVEERYDLSYEEVVNTYIASDILCFPSTYEGFGMPVLEAQVLGIPVVTSNYGAMAEVAGRGAIIVDPYEIQDIRDGIVALLSDRSLRAKMVEIGFENSLRFHPKLVTEKYLEVYNKVRAIG